MSANESVRKWEIHPQKQSRYIVRMTAKRVGVVFGVTTLLEATIDLQNTEPPLCETKQRRIAKHQDSERCQANVASGQKAGGGERKAGPELEASRDV